MRSLSLAWLAALVGLAPAACRCGLDPPFDPDCDPSIGMVEPMPVCSEEDPCTRLLATYVARRQITETSEEPRCSGSGRNDRPEYDDGEPKSWKDADGVDRYWCEYRPAGTSASSPRPLLVYVHGSGGAAHNLYDSTLLRDKAASFDLSGDSARPGFIAVATQGRFLHWPTEDPQDGTKHDTFHRNMGSPSSNRDIAFVDHIVDSLVEDGVVDVQRIYAMGWSNGARFAALYGIARHATATQGGARVAAVANYSGGDPFENIRPGYEPSCKQDPYPTSDLPLALVSRSCDGVCCDQAQAQVFIDDGKAIAPGNVAETWIEALRGDIGSPAVEWRRINDEGTVVSSCDGDCTMARALVNHVRWPDGVDDRGGRDHEPFLLGFLRDHPLP